MKKVRTLHPEFESDQLCNPSATQRIHLAALNSGQDERWPLPKARLDWKEVIFSHEPIPKGDFIP